MTSPGNQHCVNCISTLSFHMGGRQTRVDPRNHALDCAIVVHDGATWRIPLNSLRRRRYEPSVANIAVAACCLIAKTPLHGPDRTRPDPHGLFCGPGLGETPLGPCGSPTKSVRVRSGPVWSGRAHVVEFSLNRVEARKQ